MALHRLEETTVLRIGVLLRQAREQAGVTQEALARRNNTKKSD